MSKLELEIGDAIKVPDEETGGDSRLFEIQVRAFDPFCENDVNDKGAFEATEIFKFIIDDIGPVIECGFDKRQDKFHVLDPNFVPNCAAIPPFPGGGRNDPLHIGNEAPLVDVKFWYQIMASL